MADAFRGLTIRLGADARPLNQAINSIKSAASTAQKQLSAMNKALKFNPTDIAAMSSRLDLMGDKAQMSARAILSIKTAMQQTSAGTRELAAGTKNIYAEVQKTRSAYKHVDAELQRVYDSAALVYASELKSKDATLKHADAMKKAVEYVQELRSGYDSAGEKAQKLKDLIVEANSRNLGRIFDTQGEPEKLLAIVDKLRSEHKSLAGELSKLKHAEGYKAMETQLIAWRSELRQAATEAARFRSEFHSLTASSGIAKQTERIQRMDEALEQASASARKMDELFRRAPGDITLAVEKLRAEAMVQETITDKLEAQRAILSSLGSKIDKNEASTKNVYKWVSEAENKWARYSRSVDLANEKVAKLEAELKEAFNIGSTGSRSLNEISNELDKAREKAGELETKLRKADSELAKANAHRAYREAANDVRVLEAELTQARTKASALGRALDFSKTIRTMGYGLYSTLTPAIMIAGRYAIDSARDIDSAYRDMRKTVNGTEAEFEHLRDAALQFSTTHVTSADKLLEIEAIGGQLGIAAKDLEAFGETISNLDVSTNIDAEEVSEQLGKMASVVGISVQDYDNFGDALVRLGNNMPVMESDIMTLTTRYMGMGKVVGMTADQMLGWSAAASATGQKSEAAGSAMQRFISKVETAVVNGGEQLDKFAEISGMSADEFAQAFKTDASDTMYRFIEGLGEMHKRGESVNQALSDLKINNVRDKQLLEGLANQMANGADGTNLLAEALRMSSDAYHGLSTRMQDGTVEEAGDAAREASKKAEGFSGQIEMMSHNAQLLSSELATGALPYVKALGETFSGATAAVKEMPDEMKSAIVGLLGVAAAIGPVAVGVGAVGSAVDSAMEMFNKATGSRTMKAAEKVAEGVGRVGAVLADEFIDKFPAAGNAVEFFSDKIKKLGSLTGGQLALFAAMAAAVGMLAKTFIDGKAQADAFSKATEGLVKAVGNATTVQKGLEGATSGVGKANYDAVGSAKALVDEQTQLVDKMNDRAEAARTEITNLTAAEGAIDKYLNKTGLTVREQGELRHAIELLNEQYGTQYQVVDAANGMIADEKGVLLDTKDAILQYIEAKKQQVKADQLANDMVDAGAALDKAVGEYAKATKEYNEYHKQWGDQAGNQFALDDQGKNISERLSELEYARDVTAGIVEADQTAYDAIEASYDMLAQSAEHTSQSIEDLAFRSGTLQALFTGEDNAFAAFRSELAETGISVEDFNSISATKWGEIYTAWDGGANSLEGILSGMGFQLTTLTDQTSATFEQMGLNFSDFVTQLGGNAEELASKMQAAGGAAQLMANLTSEDISTALSQAGGSVDTFIANLQRIGQQKVQANVETQGTEQAATELGTVDQAVGELDGETADTYVEEEGGEEVQQTFSDVDEQVSNTDGDSANVTINVTDYATGAINSVRENLRSLDGSSATVTVNRVEAGNAAGGVSLATIRAIPRNADGGLNGIVTRATLTNVGWVGEAGDEAVFHMRHAGGAIVPLSNRTKVRPFARAVASEMPDYSLISAQADMAQSTLEELRMLHEDMLNLKLYIDSKVAGRVLAPQMNQQLERLGAANAR